MVSRDTSNPEQVKSDEEMEELRSLVELEMWRDVLKTPEGRFVVFSIIDKADIHNKNGKAYDPHMLNRQVGRDEIANEVLGHALTALPGVYNMMLMEMDAHLQKYRLREVGSEEDNG